MWGREIEGLVLTFHLAGINNQNFLMRDDQTGTFWQQINGKAVSGPLSGKQLKLIAADELTYALWRIEQPTGMVLKDAAADAPEYSPKDWDVKMQKARVVISHAGNGRTPRDLMLGVHVNGTARAYLYDRVLKEKLVQDRVGATPVLLVVGPDDASVRAFEARTTGDFYRTPDSGFMMDSATGSRWNFQGCATEGRQKAPASRVLRSSKTTGSIGASTTQILRFTRKPPHLLPPRSGPDRPTRRSPRWRLPLCHRASAESRPRRS